MYILIKDNPKEDAMPFEEIMLTAKDPRFKEVFRRTAITVGRTNVARAMRHIATTVNNELHEECMFEIE